MLGSHGADLALPGEVPLGDLLPVILTRMHPESADHGTEHDGWVVQRLGQPPLDEDRTAVELNLVDGETVYLRPRADHLPPIDFDDLVDGVGEQVRRHPHRWSVARTRFMLLVMATLVLLCGAAVLTTEGPALTRCLVAVGAAILLLLAAGVVSRAIRDTAAGTALAVVAAVYAAVAGWTVAMAAAPAAGLAVPVSLAALAAMLALAAGLTAVSDSGLVFVAVMLCCAVTALPAMIAAISGVTQQSAAAIGLSVSLIVAILLPAAAFRLGGLALPMLPGKPEELSEDIDPAPHVVVVERGAVGVRYLAALSIGLGVAQMLLGGVLVLPGGGWEAIMGALVAALLFMRARHVDGMVPRWATMVPAAALVLFVLHRLALDQTAPVRAAVLVPSLIAYGGALLALSVMLPGRRLRPYWGRAVDIAEILVATALLPVLGAVLGVYQMVRAWAS
ncbi:type VII secretion integral membrane protein EccD [Catenuloplanes atrovinosus]|uniref:Type VII secretion integral membrane protein EccD n=1 Tax=Catenuloplanes atrovinosus TaxID=137266 RepID=A0AAE3YNW8_9ACTN|nr:type VII secretion integral membrane protein EccD [Catenuloplanes atrovinosus]